MNFHHTMKDGIKLPIPSMSDTHLLNTIRLYCRKYSGENGPFKASMYDKMQPYVMEASIRGLNVTPLIQAYFSRKSAMTEEEFTQFESDYWVAVESASYGDSEIDYSGPFDYWK